jgi:hypothetical protein
MKIREIILVFITVSVFLSFGCDKDEFTPPEDGLVTREMAERYVEVSIALTKIIEDQVVKLSEFREKYGVSSSLSEFNDPEYKEKNPAAVAAWDSMQVIWNKKQDSVYHELGMSEEEWNWIAGAIITRKNSEIRQFIISEFERAEKETGSLPPQATDSN